MIAFKYTKTDGAEYLSHLDLLRHINRTLRRADIKVNLSEGFHPHPRIFLNNPLGLGVKSVAEYGAVDCAFEGDFKSLFNCNSPLGIKCLDCAVTQENPNYALTIERCGYVAEGIGEFDTAKYLAQSEITVTDKRGRTVDVRPRIFSLFRREGKLYFTLGCGENNLRPDLFCELLEREYGGTTQSLIKITSHGKYVF